MFLIYQEERLLKILEFLKVHNKISTNKISSMLNISRDTARRDIIKLTEEGAAIRTHGGIALPHFKEEVKAYKERLTTFSQQKQLIGQAGAVCVLDGELCFFDVSTTVKYLCEALQVHSIVYTHSLDNAEILSNKNNVEVHLVGGRLHAENRFFYDSNSAAQLSGINFDKAFLGATGVLEDGVYFASQEDAYIKELVSKHSKQVFLLADYSKFNQSSRYKGIAFSNIDALITDKEPPQKFIEVFKKNNIEIKIAKQ